MFMKFVITSYSIHYTKLYEIYRNSKREKMNADLKGEIKEASKHMDAVGKAQTTLSDLNSLTMIDDYSFQSGTVEYDMSHVKFECNLDGVVPLKDNEEKKMSANLINKMNGLKKGEEHVVDLVQETEEIKTVSISLEKILSNYSKVKSYNFV